MATDKKISELPLATTPLAGTEELEILQGGVNKRVASSNVGSGGAALTDGNGTTADGSAADLGGTISENTTLTLSGDFWLRLLGIVGTTARFIVDGVNNTRKSIQFRTGNVPRWDIHIEGDETGSNAEADLHFERFDDAGVFIAEALTINRATGVANFPVGPTVPTAGAGTNTTQAASTAFVQQEINGKSNALITFRTETASYTLDATDLANINAGHALKIRMNVASANVLTIPLNATQAFQTGTQIIIQQIGVGQTSIAITATGTLNSANGWLNIAYQYASVVITKIGTNEWDVEGTLAP